jgi:sulfur carrier protein ThiS
LFESILREALLPAEFFDEIITHHEVAKAQKYWCLGGEGFLKESIIRTTMVKLILRKQEFEVRPGMTLLDALKKNSILPEAVIATRNGEMIEEDEILKDGDVIKLIAAISGG